MDNLISNDMLLKPSDLVINMDNIKVYKVNDCDWVCTKWSLEDTHEWYMNYTDTDFEECPPEDIVEVSFDSLVNDEDGNQYTLKSIIIENLEDGTEDLKEPFIIASTEY